MADLPYVLTTGKIPDLLEKIETAARPERFSQDFLERLGFSSSNDRAFVPLLRRLGFVDDSGNPTPLYDDLRDPAKRSAVLAQQMRQLYSELFSVNTEIQNAGDAELRAAVARVTGRDESISGRIATTFKALAQQADFSGSTLPKPETPTPKSTEADRKSTSPAQKSASEPRPRPEFHYNIQLILPATTEVSVYNAIFKSLRENLGL